MIASHYTSRIQSLFENETRGFQEEMDRLHRMLDDAKFDFIRLEQEKARDRSEYLTKIREKDLEIASFKQSVALLEQEVTHVKAIGNSSFL